MTMPPAAFAVRILIVATGLALGLMTATATLAGTPAWSNVALVLREGPGDAYDITGEIAGEIRIVVDRCSNRWCKIRAEGERGWVPIDHVSFGQAPGGPFSGPKLNYPAGGPGLVCFYEGANFTGGRICAESGTVVRDLLLLDRDNRVASISVEGNVSALVCRDFNFHSYCERIIESKPRLPRFLYRAVSSYRIY